ncbi:MAG: hypothetical protein AB4290_11230 [Spirulina sp.]
MDESNEIQLTQSALKRLGNLVNMKEENLASAIRQRGGGQSQVEQIRTDYQDLKVGEVANLAGAGDADAITALKILKQARKKQEKYRGR